MHYRVLGRTGLRVSVIGIGTRQLGGEWGRSYSQSEADAMLDRAAALGIFHLTPSRGIFTVPVNKGGGNNERDREPILPCPRGVKKPIAY